MNTFVKRAAAFITGIGCVLVGSAMLKHTVSYDPIPERDAAAYRGRDFNKGEAHGVTCLTYNNLATSCTQVGSECLRCTVNSGGQRLLVQGIPNGMRKSGGTQDCGDKVIGTCNAQGACAGNTQVLGQCNDFEKAINQ